jgi:hypothetical protein
MSINYEEEIYKVEKIETDNYYYFKNVRTYKYENKEYQDRNENLKYMGINNKKLPEKSDDIYSKTQDYGKYIWDVNIYDTVVLPTLNKHFYDDNYYIDSSKKKELPGFHFVPYIDKLKFKKLKHYNPEELQNIINENNNIIIEINKKLKINKIFEPFELVNNISDGINEINSKYDEIEKQINGVIEDVQNMIKHTYRINCPDINCKENKMDYLKNNLLTRNYHKGLSSEYSAKILDTYSNISTNILLKYKKILTQKIFQILNIDDISIGTDTDKDPKLNTNEDFIEEIINNLYNSESINIKSKLKQFIDLELNELNKYKNIDTQLFLFIIKNINYNILLTKLEIDVDKLKDLYLDVYPNEIINILKIDKSDIDNFDHQKLCLIFYIIINNNNNIDDINKFLFTKLKLDLNSPSINIDKLLLITLIMNTLDNDNILKNRQINRLESQIDKRCDNVHKIGSFNKYSYIRVKDEYLKENILLQEVFNEPDKKQLLYMTATYMNYYRKNKSITQEPFNERSFKMSIISWSNLINKALTNCWVENSDHTFPLRLVLHKHSGFLHFQSYYNEINKNTRLRFMGFFLVKFDEKTDGLIDMTKIRNEKCREYYDFTDTFKSKYSNYYTIFVFRRYRNNNPTRYSLFNFKCNEVYFGSTTEFKRILYTGELQQLISMNAQNKVYYYLLLEKVNDISNLTKYEDLNNICTTLLKNETGKKKQEDCIEANLEPSFLNKLLNLGYYPYSIKNEYIDDMNININIPSITNIDEQHIFISKFNFDEIYKYFDDKKIDVKKSNYIIIDKILKKLNELQHYNKISFIETKYKLIQFIENDTNIYFKKDLISIIDNTNNITQLFKTLIRYNNNNNYIELTVNNKKYGLFQCHFDWSSNFKYLDEINTVKKKIKNMLIEFKNKIDFYKKDKYSKIEIEIINKYENLINKLHINERLYIKDGDMTYEKKQELLSDRIYIKNLCTFGTDILRDITPYFKINSPKYYELYNMFLRNSEIFKKIDEKILETNINILD